MKNGHDAFLVSILIISLTVLGYTVETLWHNCGPNWEAVPWQTHVAIESHLFAILFAILGGEALLDLLFQTRKSECGYY